MGERLVVIGGDAAGMSAASQARRLRSDLEIVALERGNWTSYSACGIPYLVAGDVDRLETLVARSAQTFRDRHNIDVRLRHEATAIDIDARKVEVRDHEHDRTYVLPFDQLMIGIGARPRRPDLPGIDCGMVHGVQTLDDASALLEVARSGSVRRVAVVGGGYIGLEMAEAFCRRGAKVTVLEREPEVMGTLDPDMGALVSTAMRQHGIEVRKGVAVTGFETGVVHTDSDDLETDLVILGLGVVPNAELAGEAGLKLGAAGAISVDRRQQTSVEGVWAAGDCAETFHLVSRRPFYVALGTVANKTGRVAGLNIGGRYATFPGVVGTAVTRVCDTEVARTGLNESEATAAGFEYVTATIDSMTRAHYMPDAKPLKVKLVVEAGGGRVLGAQIVGEEGAAKRIDVLATAVTAEMTVAQVVDLDLSYAPPFSGVWEPVQVAARQAMAALGGPK